MSLDRSSELVQVRSAWPKQVSSAGFDYVLPSNLEGHNFFVRTPFWVFLNSMEIPLSQETIYMPVEDNR